MYSKRNPFLLLLSLLCLMGMPGHAQTPVPVDENFRALTQSGSRILGLDYDGKVFVLGEVEPSLVHTINGEFDDTYYALSAVGDTVMVVGSNALMARSGDAGDTWAEVEVRDAGGETIYVFGDLKALAGRAGDVPANNQWIAAGDDGDQGAVFSSNDDGITWSEAVSIGGVEFSGATWSGSVRIVCGMNTFFEGVIYRSENGDNWVAIVPSVPEGDEIPGPLLALAADDAGAVLAVGEGGIILHSTDHGATFQKIEANVSVDLSAVVATGPDSFVVGGDGKSLFQVSGTTFTELRESAGGAPPVEALLFADGEVLLGGSFSAAPRTLPFQLQLEITSFGYRLTISEALSGKAYSLETSTTLQDWEPVGGSAKGGVGDPLQWNEPKDGTRRFWRVTEF